MSLESLPFFLIKKNFSEGQQFLHFTGMSSFCAEYLGWKKPELSYGKFDYDIPSNIAELAPNFNAFDLIALEKNKDLKTLEFLNCSQHGWKCFLVKRVPSETGITLCGIEIPPPFIYMTGISPEKAEKNVCYTVDETFDRLPLSPRQEECLYYMVRGKTSKETARLLGIGHRSVEKNVERLKFKLGCLTKGDLIEKSFETGFVYFMPKSILLKNELSLGKRPHVSNLLSNI